MIPFLLSTSVIITQTQGEVPVSALQSNGKWWQTISKEHRLGFLAGFTDCALAEGHDSRFKSQSWYTLEPFLTSYFAGIPLKQSTSVESVLTTTQLPQKPSSPSNGDNHTGKHGIFDGEYWRQSSSDHRLGFIEGYIRSLKHYEIKAGSFPRSAKWYQAQISTWYGTKDDDPGEIIESRVDTPIAVVLLRLKANAGHS